MGVTETMVIHLSEILAAAKRIAPEVRRTPIEEWEEISQETGARVFFKLENLQKTGSFKVRGALNRLGTLPQNLRDKGIICASAGNHAQGVALASRLYGASALVIVPENTPSTKVAGTRRYGAEVRTLGRDYDEAEAKAWEIARQTGRFFLHAFEDPGVIAGQGTVGLEILQDVPDVDVVVVPAGGGGLIAGIASACRAVNPRIRVHGVQSEASPPWYHSFREGHIVSVPIEDSVAEGLAGGITDGIFGYVKGLVDGFILVSEDEIWRAMRYCLIQHHLVIEGSAAVSLAAVTSGRLDIKGMRVAAVLTGGNVDSSRLERVLG